MEHGKKSLSFTGKENGSYLCKKPSDAQNRASDETVNNKFLKKSGKLNEGGELYRFSEVKKCKKPAKHLQAFCMIYAFPFSGKSFLMS